MDLLQEARGEIDQIDNEMAVLFQRRMKAVEKVVTHKIAHNLPILDAGREEQVVAKNLERLSPENQDLAPFYEDFIRHNMAISRAMQSKIMATDRIAYQGVPGAFSHIAMKTIFPHGREKAYGSWKEVVQALEEGVVSYGVLPFENSHAGDVSEVLDLCFIHPKLHVCQMYDMAIHQNLLGLPDAKVTDIKKVISHPQALMQSAKFIETIGATKQEYPNTAVAAEYVANLGDKSVGAIASLQTAELYNLNVLASNINQSADNTTRFLVLSAKAPQDGNRFSILFTVHHKAGSLAQVISLVAEAGFNMESIKSRPMPQVSWEYYFYMELIGNRQDALDLEQKLEAVCQSVRILGIYEREETR